MKLGYECTNEEKVGQLNVMHINYTCHKAEPSDQSLPPTSGERVVQ